ncbi:MAG: FHA domain-containing protein [Phycisphaerae bacterium]
MSSSLAALHLLVDGGGSYLILRDSHATIGRAASFGPAQIPIFSDLGERHAEIARVEDDYFLMSPHGSEIGGRRGRQQLLRDGDRVVLARRRSSRFVCRVAAAAAPADISDTTKIPNDVPQQ